jgi:hypothetical protein
MRFFAAAALALLAPALATAAAPAYRAPARGPSGSADEGSAATADHFPWIGVRLGGLAAVSSASAGTPTAAGGGAYVLFDGRDYLADIAVDLFFGDDARLVAGGLGVYYPFMPENVSPYAGGGLKLGYSRFGGNGVFGLQLYAAAGLLVGRSWAPQLRFELAWFVALGSEEGGASPGGSRAHGPLLTLGIAL